MIYRRQRVIRLLIGFCLIGSARGGPLSIEPSKQGGPTPTLQSETKADAEIGAAGHPGARVTENKIFQGIPILVSRPPVLSRKTGLVVLFHGFGPPQNPQALAQVLRLEKMDTILAFINLPLVADRLPRGGREELLQLQKENFVNGFFFRSISGAAEELGGVVTNLKATYDLATDQPIGLFGFSAGGAAALLAMLESDLPISAAVIVNAPMSLVQNVENWEKLFKTHFEWDAASQAAARRYDVEGRAEKIAGRQILPALLLMQGNADQQFGLELTRRAYEVLKRHYLARGKPAQIKFEVIPGLAHNFGPAPGTVDATLSSIDEEIEQKTKDWFDRYLAPGLVR